MSENPVFNINFVKAIEKYSCLWNYTLTEYSKRNLTEKAWIEVGNEMNDSVSNCRERWRNIRGAFSRSLKNPPSGSGANSKKKYYLNEYLEFLLPYIKNKPSTGNLETASGCSDNLESTNNEFEEHTENEQFIEPQTEDITKFNSPFVMPNNTSEESSIDKSLIIAHKFKKQKVQTPATTSSDADAAFIEWLQNKKTKGNTQEDANMSFLRSLLPDMSKMTEKQNRRFRQKVIGLIDDILEDADIRSCHSSTSNTYSVSSFTNNSRPSSSNSIHPSTPSPNYPVCPTPNPNYSAQYPVQNEWSIRREENKKEYLTDYDLLYKET